MIVKNNECVEIYNNGYHAVSIKPISDNSSQDCTRLGFCIPDYPDQSFKLNVDDVPKLIDYLQSFYDSVKDKS